MTNYGLAEPIKSEVPSEELMKFIDDVFGELISFSLDEQNYFISKIKDAIIQDRTSKIEQKSKDVEFWKFSTEKLFEILKQ